jgi:hypothetical protein
MLATAGRKRLLSKKVRHNGNTWHTRKKRVVNLQREINGFSTADSNGTRTVLRGKRKSRKSAGNSRKKAASVLGK